jgi:hypothetical protein
MPQDDKVVYALQAPFYQCNDRHLTQEHDQGVETVKSI